jgi:solute carrier family 8 (sodium/calcium exchanger)
METHSLGFSVVLFCSLAMIALLVMMLRRSKAIGGELGGPRGYKIATSCLFVFLWLFYVLMSSLEAYGYINGMYCNRHTEIESLFYL